MPHVGPWVSAGFARKVVYCASANQRSVLLAADEQDGIRKVPILGGFTLAEIQTLAFERYPVLQTAHTACVTAKANLDISPDNAARLEAYQAAKSKAVQWEVLLNADGKVVAEGLMGVTGGVGLDVFGPNDLLIAFAKQNPDEANFATCLGEWKAKKGEKVKAHV